MTREAARQRVIELRADVDQLLARLEPEAADDSAGLLRDLDAMGEAYRAALGAGMRLAYDWAAEKRPVGEGEADAPPMTVEEALAAVRRVAEKNPTWEVVG